MNGESLIQSLCPYCKVRLNYVALRCPGCGKRYTSDELIRLAGKLLSSGSSLKSIRRQLSETARGMGKEILEASKKVFMENEDSTSIIALIASRDFGDPRIISESLLKSRYPFASQALRVEIAQNLLAIQTFESEAIIEDLKKVEVDPVVKKALEEPMVTSEGLSRDLNTNLEGGKKWKPQDEGKQPGIDAKETHEKEIEGKESKEKAEGEDEKGKPVTIVQVHEEKKTEVDLTGKVEHDQIIEVSEPVEKEDKPADVGKVDSFPADIPVKTCEASSDLSKSESVKASDQLRDSGSFAQEEKPPQVSGEIRKEDDVDLVALSGSGTLYHEESLDTEKQTSEGAKPPPLPPESTGGKEIATTIGEVAIPKKQTTARSHSMLIIAATFIVFLGAVIGYAVINIGKGKTLLPKMGDEGRTVLNQIGEGNKASKDEVESPDKDIQSGSENAAEKKKEVVSHILRSTVSASSFHKKYPPENVIDGDPATVWQEAKLRKPIGEWLKFDFPKEVTITKIGIVSGFDYIDKEGKDYYPLNCRLKDAEIIFSSGESLKVSLEDKRAVQYISVDPAIKTKSIRLTVFDVYKGSWFYDNALGEVEIWGYDENEE